MDQLTENGYRRLENKIFYYKLVVIAILLTSESLTMPIKIPKWQPGPINKIIPLKLINLPGQAALTGVPMIWKLPELPDDCIMYILLVLNLQTINLLMIAIQINNNCNIRPDKCYYGFEGESEETFSDIFIWSMFQIIITLSFGVTIWLIKSLRKVFLRGIITAAKWILSDISRFLTATTYVIIGIYFRVQTFAATIIVGQMACALLTEYAVSLIELGNDAEDHTILIELYDGTDFVDPPDRRFIVPRDNDVSDNRDQNEGRPL